MGWRARAAAALVLGWVAVQTTTAAATPQPAPGEGPIEAFAVHDASSAQTFGYVLWAKILDTAVVDDGAASGVDYGALGADGRNALDSFVNEMTAIPVSTLNRDEQLAYWLNLYNAAWLRLMFDQFYRLGRSDQDFAGRSPWAEERFSVKRLFTARDNPWTVRNLTVEGVTLSLNDIEHRILYAHWPAELVAYGLSCPLRGCPALSRQPYQGGQVLHQLREAAKRFIADERNVKIRGDAATLSELYRQPAFGGEARVLEHLRGHADPARAHRLTAVRRIAGYEFDWKLAGKQPPARLTVPRGQMNRGAGTGGYFQE
jgi:hypothetical protein